MTTQLRGHSASIHTLPAGLLQRHTHCNRQWNG